MTTNRVVGRTTAARRAACRRESIGFTRVHDYDTGTRVGAHLQTDVPTCTLEESLRDVCDCVRAAGADDCFVINEQGIVLGCPAMSCL